MIPLKLQEPTFNLFSYQGVFPKSKETPGDVPIHLKPVLVKKCLKKYLGGSVAQSDKRLPIKIMVPGTILAEGGNLQLTCATYSIIRKIDILLDSQYNSS